MAILVDLLMLTTICIAGYSLFRPGAALALMFAMYASEQAFQTRYPIFVMRGDLGNIIPVVVCFLAISAQFFRDSKTPSIGRVQLYIIALLVFAGVSTAWAVNPEESFEKFSKTLPYMAGFCVIAPLCIKSDRDLEDCLRATLILMAALIPALATSNMGGRAIMRSDGLASNPLAVGTIAGAAALLGASYAVRDKNYAFKGLWILVALGGLYVCFLSGSRGQLAASIIGIFVTLFLIISTSLKKGAVVGFSVAGLLAFAGVYAVDYFVEQSGGWTGRFATENIVASVRHGRLGAAAALLEEFQNGGGFTWLFGLGSSSSYELIGFYCHVVPVEVLCELGLVGFVTYMVVNQKALANSWGYLKNAHASASTKATAATLIGLFVFYFLLTLKQGSLLTSTDFLLVCIVLERLIAQSKAYETVARSIRGMSRKIGPRQHPTMVNSRTMQ